MNISYLIQNLVKSNEYDYLRTNYDINNRIIFIAPGGSYSYRINTPESDLDIRVLTYTSPGTLLGLKKSKTCKYNDVEVWQFDLFYRGIINCNPIYLEALGCEDSDYYIVDDYCSRLILDNRIDFISVKGMLNYRKSIYNYNDKILELIRNRDYTYANKYMSYVINRMYIGLNILENNTVKTYIPEISNLLIDIKSGKYLSKSNSNIIIDSSYYDMLNDLDRRFDYALENTSLQYDIDIDIMHDIVYEINKRSIKEIID